MKNSTKNRLALTAAVLLSGCASSPATNHSSNSNKMPTENTDMGQCTGINSCKGSASCAVSGQNNCAGQNTCKGKGWIPLSKADCNARHGRFIGFRKN